MKKEQTPRTFTDSILSRVAVVLISCYAARAKAIYATLICASFAGIFTATANAQPDITWQTPVTISGATDVSTLGALFGTWAPGNDWGGVNRSDY